MVIRTDDFDQTHAESIKTDDDRVSWNPTFSAKTDAFYEKRKLFLKCRYFAHLGLSLLSFACLDAHMNCYRMRGVPMVAAASVASEGSSVQSVTYMLADLSIFLFYLIRHIVKDDMNIRKLM